MRMEVPPARTKGGVKPIGGRILLFFSAPPIQKFFLIMELESLMIECTQIEVSILSFLK